MVIGIGFKLLKEGVRVYSGGFFKFWIIGYICGF